MPLRDHFRPPLTNTRSWDELHGQWPAMLVLALNRKLPRRFVAGPQIHLAAFAQIDVSTFEKDDDENGALYADDSNGGLATAVWAPARPTLTVKTDLPAQDEYEVRVYDAKHGRRLVAAIELVSPANKDRPEHRRAFVAKCAALLQNQVSVTIVDLVTVRAANLYAELLDMIGQSDPALGAEPPPTYAVACRATKRDSKPGENWQLETWLQVLQIGLPLPTLPLWLADNFSMPLDLEASYEETCNALRIS
jgi:uncharacterized protein DUF4058